ncbi:unnamed protein product [Periconia digitata]|uniref:Uncharacterized protein n=1 Tax=Periconia digitata TaxID=1303443 RepID=A0A9W4U6I2_9PLEO|nr:unnamed protein product [Periconia digitata]
MFARSAPRVSARASRFAQCEAEASSLTPRTYSKLSPRTAWRPNLVIQQSIIRRNASGASPSREFWKEQVRRNPVLFPFALISVAGLIGWSIWYIPWYYENVIIKPFQNYPDPVANKLRRAMFYTRKPNEDIFEAARYFREALIVARMEGLDAFGDHVMAIKYHSALVFERAQMYGEAIKVLEQMRIDCERWLEEESDKHWNDGNRARVLKNMIQATVKLGQLYDIKYVRETKNAEKRLVWAVETMLGELQRREKEGLKPGEGDFMNEAEIGPTLEALGTHYEMHDSHHLALPLFLRALDHCPPESCHSVILMNNIATCLAQQKLPPSPPPTHSKSKESTTPPSPVPTRAHFLAQAKTWANQAIARAATISSSTRDEECDTGCTAATHNLGEFAEMVGDFTEARKFYDEAGRIAYRAGFKQGSVHAKEGLKRVEKLEKAAKSA